MKIVLDYDPATGLVTNPEGRPIGAYKELVMEHPLPFMPPAKPPLKGGAQFRKDLIRAAIGNMAKLGADPQDVARHALACADAVIKELEK